MNRILFLIALGFGLQAAAQPLVTLQQCIDTALANSIPVKQSALLMESARIGLGQARANRLPSLGADISHGINAGRSIDPFSNTYVNQSVKRAGYGIGSDMILFQGGNLNNRVKEQAAALEASRMEWQQEKDNLILNVITAYLQVLHQEDQVSLLTRQIETSRQALDRLQVLNNQGAIRPSDVSDLQGQLVNDRLNILSATSQLQEARLLLLQWMNKPYDSTLRIARLSLDDVQSSGGKNATAIFQEALRNFSLVKAVELRRKSSYHAVKAARGQLFPTLSFGAAINTNYSSLARDAAQEKISYGSQLKNNRFSAVGLGLSIPIFNAATARNRVRLASINLKSAELTEQETRRQLRQAIDQAYLNWMNAMQRYELLQEQVTAYETSFKAAEARFLSGVGTSIDYLNAKDNLDQARSNAVSARYHVALRKKILDYYAGSEL